MQRYNQSPVLCSTTVPALLLLVLTCGAPMAEAASGIGAVMTSGDTVILNPFESGLIFTVVTIVAAVLELMFDKANDIENKYFHVMFEAMSEEMVIVGVLALAIKFAMGVISLLPSRYLVIFEWAHMCLFFMAITFFTIIFLVLTVTRFSNQRWAKFEAERMDEDDDGLQGREQSYKISYYKFLTTMEAYGYTAEYGVKFHTYLLKMERRNLVSLTDLTWKSWLSLSTLVMLNAFRTRLTPTQGEDPTTGLPQLNERDRLFNYSSYIVCCGYGTLVVYLVIHAVLQHRLAQFLNARIDTNMDSTVTKGGHMANLQQRLVNKDDLEDPQSYLPWQSKESTLELLQLVIMFFEWYLSVFMLSFTWAIFKFVPSYAVPLIVAAIVPFVIFLFFFPWTLTTVTIMSSLGASLDEGVVKLIIDRQRSRKDDPHGHGGAHGHASHDAKPGGSGKVSESGDGRNDDTDEPSASRYYLRSRQERFPHRDRLAQKMAITRGYAQLDSPWPTVDPNNFSPRRRPQSPASPARGATRGYVPVGASHRVSMASSPTTRRPMSPPDWL
eukprot:PhM_4_TR19139/c0_g1_i2/m.14799